MAVICIEDKSVPRMRDMVFAATTLGAEYYDTVCAHCVNGIPESERSEVPVLGGIDIHRVNTEPNTGYLGDDDTVSLALSTMGERMFSISSVAASQHLPASAAKYLS